jgi:SAM-dependent methyltransferase
MTREILLKSLINIRGKGLEIGPGYNPLLPKRDGFRVETADYTDADGLRLKYAGNPHIDPSRIEPVDHVLGSNGLFQTIGKRGYYDYIVASHVIEHTPDLIRFVKDCENLLSPSGVLLLAVPDKRYCFDVFQPLSSIGQIYQAYVDCRTRPSLGSILDDRLSNAVRGNAIGWAMDDSSDISFFLDIAQAKQIFASDSVATHYIDVHVWKFVPSSFRLILNDLFELGEIGLREATFHESVGNEFYCTLSSSASGCAVDRLTLAKRILQEHSEILA